jgi:hypothetical protein
MSFSSSSSTPPSPFPKNASKLLCKLSSSPAQSIVSTFVPSPPTPSPPSTVLLPAGPQVRPRMPQPLVLLLRRSQLSHCHVKSQQPHFVKQSRPRPALQTPYQPEPTLFASLAAEPNSPLIPSTPLSKRSAPAPPSSFSSHFNPHPPHLSISLLQLLLHRLCPLVGQVLSRRAFQASFALKVLRSRRESVPLRDSRLRMLRRVSRIRLAVC